MKKHIAVLVLSVSTLALAVSGLSSIAIIDNNNLSEELQRILTKSSDAMDKDASRLLSSKILVFETAESNSDFKIEIDGAEVTPAKSISLKAITKESTPHEIDKLAVLKEETLTNVLTAYRMKNGTVKFFASKSVVRSDYEKIRCAGCNDPWRGYTYSYDVKSPRDVATGQSSGKAVSPESAPNGDSGSGFVSNDSAKIITDRDTGRSKGRISVTDEKLLTAWLELSKERPEKELVIEFNKYSSRLISDFQNAKMVKLIVPVAMEKELRLMSMDYAIKEQGIKLAIQGDNITVTLQVSEAKPMEPK